MTRAEEAMAGRIDRLRDKAATSARTLQVREMARAETNCAVMSQPEEDRAIYMQEAINHLATLYTASQGPAATGSLYSKLSKTPIIGLSRAIASARAEQLFAPKAANDRESGQ